MLTISDLDHLDGESTLFFFDNLHQIALTLCGNAPVGTFDSKAQAEMRRQVAELCPFIIQERAQMDPHEECQMDVTALRSILYKLMSLTLYHPALKSRAFQTLNLFK